MANENTIKTRIQLKCDTEANWNKSVLVSEGGVEKTTGTSFVPRKGEVIIYSADDSHPFSRFKVGDGITNVVKLPFTDHDNIKNIYLAEGITMFPGVGKTNINYIDIITDNIYQWENNQYVLKYGLIKQSLQDVLNFDAGTMTNLKIELNSGCLTVVNGTEPSLTISDINVVTDKGIII